MLSNQQNLWIQNFDSWAGNSWPAPTFTGNTNWPQAADTVPQVVIPPQAQSMNHGKPNKVKPGTKREGEEKGPATKPKFHVDQPVPPSFSPESFYILPTQTSFDPSNDTAWKQYFVSPSELLTPPASSPKSQVYNNSWSSPPSPAQSPATSPPSSPAKTSPKGLTPNTRSKRNLDIETELSKQNLYKTELCRSWMETGLCPYGSKCQFAHGREELRPVKRHPKYKTEICRTFHTTGTCPYGKRCRFIHDPAERSVSPGLSPTEADALELDIQRQLAALRLSLENEGIDASTVSRSIQPASVPNAPFANEEDFADDEEEEEYPEESDDEFESVPQPQHMQSPPQSPQIPAQQAQIPIQAQNSQKLKQQEETEASQAQSRKKTRLPFFQRLLSKKH